MLPRATKIIHKGILYTLATLCFVALTEGILRLMGYSGAPEMSMTNIRAVDDPVLNWRYVPGSEVRVGRSWHRYNKAGFLDIDHEVEKAPHVIRILIIGDSAPDAGDVEWDTMFAALLQTGLGTSYEVVSVQMGGLNTPQEIHVLEEHGLIYDPDLVILNFILNDCDFHTEYKAAQRYRTQKDSVIGVLGIPINPEIKRTLKSSALVYFVKQRFENALGLLFGKNEIEYIERLWNKPECLAKVQGAFDQLQQLRGELSFSVLIVIWPAITNFDQYRFGPIHRWIEDAANRTGFQTLDLFPHLAKTSYRDLQVTAEDNIHPNGRGRKIAVHALLDWIRRDNLN